MFENICSKINSTSFAITPQRLENVFFLGWISKIIIRRLCFIFRRETRQGANILKLFIRKEKWGKDSKNILEDNNKFMIVKQHNFFIWCAKMCKLFSNFCCKIFSKMFKLFAHICTTGSVIQGACLSPQDPRYRYHGMFYSFSEGGH